MKFESAPKNIDSEINTLAASIPESAEQISSLSTTEIVTQMDNFDLLSLKVKADNPETERLWAELHGKYKLLEEELDKRVRGIEIPEAIMTAARDFVNKVTAERDMENWKKITADWKKLSETDPLYNIALKFVESELPLNQNNKDRVLSDAYKLVKKYFKKLTGIHSTAELEE